MKSFLTPLAAGLAVATLLLVTGCQCVTTTCTQDVGAPTFAKVDPAHVQILRTEPTQPHERIGEVKAETSSPNVSVTKIEDALRAKAAKLGADAVVVVHDTTQVTGAQVVGGLMDRTIEETEGRVVIAVAIKYKPAK